MNWNTTKLIAVGSLAVLHFLIAVPIKAFIGGIGGNPLGGLLYLITGPILSVVTLLIVREFGCVTIKNILYTLMVFPSPHIYPFPFYLVWGLIQGIVLDFLFYFLKHKERLSSAVIGGMDSFIQIFFLYLAYLTIGFAGSEKLPSVILESVGIIWRLMILFMTFFVIGMVSGYVGYLIYKKLEDTNIVRRIQGESDD